MYRNTNNAWTNIKKKQLKQCHKIMLRQNTTSTAIELLHMKAKQQVQP